VLKLPLAVGTSWRSGYGGQIRIVSIAASIDTPAGHFDGCVQTVENLLGDKEAPYTQTTTFCPEVGMVEEEMVDVTAGATRDKRTLKSYAGPIRMRQDGGDQLLPGTPDVSRP
jgi:hypothetical protein